MTVKPGWFTDGFGNLVAIQIVSPEKIGGLVFAKGFVWRQGYWDSGTWGLDTLTGPWTGPLPDGCVIPDTLKRALGMPGEEPWWTKWEGRNRGGEDLLAVIPVDHDQLKVILSTGSYYHVKSNGRLNQHELTMLDLIPDLIPIKPPPPPFDPKPTEPGPYWFTTVPPKQAKREDWVMRQIIATSEDGIEFLHVQLIGAIVKHPEGYWRRAVPPSGGDQQ